MISDIVAEVAHHNEAELESGSLLLLGPPGVGNHFTWASLTLPLRSPYVPLMFPLCLPYVPLMFALRSPYVCLTFPLCLPYIPLMFALCSPYVCLMFPLCNFPCASRIAAHGLKAESSSLAWLCCAVLVWALSAFLLQLGTHSNCSAADSLIHGP